MVSSPKEYYFDVSPDKEKCREFIINNHYSRTCPGVKHYFALKYNNEIIGVCAFGQTSRKEVKVPYATDIIELVRLVIIDSTPKNTESYFISKCLNWIKLNSHYEAVVSFASPSEGHEGIIYKASNFQELNPSAPSYYYLTEDGNRINKRQVWVRAKKNGIKESEQVGIENLKIIPELPKNKFVFYLSDIKQRKNLIYGLCDPDTMEVRYVGKSTSGMSRPKNHFKPSSLKEKNYKANWIKSVLNQGKKPIIIILKDEIEDDDLSDVEEFYIFYYRQIGHKLTNQTDGGEGALGRVCLDETKEKIGNKASIRQKGKKLPIGMKTKKEHILIDGIEHRDCSKCKIQKSLSEFRFDKKENRWMSYCKSCYNKLRANYRGTENKLTKKELSIIKKEAGKKGSISLKDYYKYNPQAKDNLSKQRSKAICGTHVITGEVVIFESALKAKECGFQNSNIGQAIKNNKPYKNYIWKFTI